MLTSAFKKRMALMPESGIQIKGLLEARAANGTNYFLANNGDTGSSWPKAPAWTLSLSATSAGIVLGTGGTPATEDDYVMEAAITSGISAVITSISGVSGGAPYIEYNLVITNTGSSAVSIREIGYNQNLPATPDNGSSSGIGNRVYLLDRTVLITPVTIPAGETGVIRYTLKTELAD